MYFTAHQPHDLTPDFHPWGLTILLCLCISLYRYTEVLEYLTTSGAEIFRTDLQGAIVMSFDGRRGVSVRGWRKQVRE